MPDNSNFAGLPLQFRDYIDAMGDWASDQTVVYVMPANITPAPTAAAWSYTVPFELRSERTGKVIPINGTIAATVGDTSTAGTATVSSAAPVITMGRGTVNILGDAQSWLNTETATLTLTYTNLRAGTDTDTFVITFTT